jgi:putative PIN family toxin of toxin-antitoxin system
MLDDDNITCNINSSPQHIPMRLVLDTTVMVAAIRSDAGASRRLLLGALERRLTLLASVPLMVEYQAVMTRPQHLEASGLSEEDVGVLLDAVAGIAERVRLAFLWRPAARDPNDDMVLEAAVNGGVDAIVTFNVRGLVQPAVRFGISTLRPPEALTMVEKGR